MHFASVKERFLQAMGEGKRSEAAKSPDRLCFHLMPPVGWLNDPNGLCQNDGTYHIYYQFAPENPEGTGKKGWGHYSTKNWIDYQEEPVALFPETLLDEGGVYSGSALVCDDGAIRYFYTGNRKLPGNYDYINEGRQHWTIRVDSEDAVHLGNRTTLLKNSDYPEDLSCHVRDPKVWKEDGQYRMVLGARTKDSRGKVLIYKSEDLDNWNLENEIIGDTDYGYMWECPDLLELDGHQFLLTCLQGQPQQGVEFENLYPSGYFIVDGTPSDDQPMKAHDFRALDHGFDFYAPQTFIDESGRRILVGWMGLPDVDYKNRETESGWQHALTLPRRLSVKDGKLLQYPIEEIFTLEERDQTQNLMLKPDQPVILPGPVCEIQLKPQTENWNLELRKDVTLCCKDGLVTLSMKESGFGRQVRHARTGQVDSIDIFSDTSSLEIFINHGEAVFTTRVYDSQKDLHLESTEAMEARIVPFRAFTITQSEED